MPMPFTGKQGYESLKNYQTLFHLELTKKQEQDEDVPKKIYSKDIMFGCTGTIGELIPMKKFLIKSQI